MIGQTPRPASGDQFELRLSIPGGQARAVIGQVAAVLREYSVDGVHYTETWPDDEVPPMGCGIVLAPWPNRVQDGEWTAADGTLQQLDITEVGRHTAIHGLLRNTAYTPVEHTASSVMLVAGIFPQHGYPFNLDTTVTYRLTADGLRVSHTVTNRGAASAPFGVGAHPYLRIGDTPIEQLTLTVAGDTHAPIDRRWIPRGSAPVGEHGPDLRQGKLLGEVNCDVALTDLAVQNGRHEHRLSAADGSALVLWTDTAFGWVQLYTPPDFPGRGSHRRLAVAVEPMTCGANALRTGEDLIHLAPGETWSAAWGLKPQPVEVAAGSPPLSSSPSVL